MIQHIGKYIVDSLIAEGGMARIYRAHSEGVGGVDKVVALKCLQSSISEDDAFIQMLMDEARITVRMNHKNVCQTYGLEHEGNDYFIAMELINGLSLDKLIRWVLQNRNGFSVESVVYIVSEACSGLSYAHRMTADDGTPLGIIHRDINPQNICISREGEVKLIDFGIAKAKHLSQETVVGSIKGKFNYMSPEQARGDKLDQRADIFALGAVMYELLSGHMLYPLSLDDSTLRTKVRMADYEPIETYCPQIHPTLRKILAKALARDITQRFATARDFLLALSQFNHDECRVFDSLSMSSLVSHCLDDNSPAPQPSKNKSSSGAAPKVPSQVNFDTMKTMSASLSSIQNTISPYPGHKGLPNYNDELEDGPTSLFSKEDFDAYLQNRSSSQPTIQDLPVPSRISVSNLKPAISEINRAVNLDIDKPNDGETMMLKMPNPAQPDSASKVSLLKKLSQLNEKTLVAIIITLVLLFVGALVLVLRPSEQETTASAVNEAVPEIRLNSIPQGAEIFINGQAFGKKTPANVPANAKTMQLQYKYYETADVDLSTATHDEVNIKLIPKTASINVDTIPPGALIYLNGSTTPQPSPAPLRVHVKMTDKTTIKAEMNGYHSDIKDIVWLSDTQGSQSITLTLVKDNSD